MLSKTLTILTALLGAASAANHEVEVGKGGNVFEPNSMTAAPGDTVTFKFVGSQHDVAQASFNNPCVPSAGGFYSGKMSAQDGKSFMITVNGTTPIWFYCSVNRHCQGGMVGVINPNSNTQEAFAAKAAQAPASQAPASVGGGMLMGAGETMNGGGASPTGGAMATKIPAALAVAAAGLVAYL